MKHGAPLRLSHVSEAATSDPNGLEKETFPSFQTPAFIFLNLTVSTVSCSRYWLPNFTIS